MPADFYASDGRVRSAHAAYEMFGKHLQLVASDSGLQYRETDEFRVLLGSQRNAVCSFFTWRPNTLEDAQLQVGFYDGLPDIPGFDGHYGSGRRLRSLRYTFESLPAGDVWIGIDEAGAQFSAPPLAAHDLSG